MYIVPNTTIYLLKNIPLNKSYEHTVYYPDKDTQAQAFMTYKKYTLTDYSYQRSQLGTIRVHLKYEQLIDCNYLMFKNTNFENKWFYAFITGIGYVSNDVTDVYYDLDVMQTWCYDYTFGKTFVERHHDAYDRLYANTVPEGLELGSEYRLIQGKSYSYAQPLSWVIIATTTVNVGISAQSGIITGVYTGLVVYYLETEADLNKVVYAFKNAGQEDAIVAFYQCPRIDKNKITTINTDEITFTQQMNLGNAYKPRNKKLFSYPYSFLEVYNTLGTSVELKFDQFSNFGSSEVEFKVEKVIFPQANLVITPKWYRGYQWDYEYSSVYGLFPTCAFAGDAFKVWWAQNKNSYLASMNAIGNTYDTNQAIAQNNYTMAGLNASNARANAHIQANTALAQAENSNKASLAVNSAQQSRALIGDVQGTASKIGYGAMAGLATSGLNVGGAIVGGIAGGLLGATETITNQNIYNEQANQINTNLLNSQIGAQAGEAISANTFQTAMKNATLAQTNAQLSNLNAYQNATAQLMAKKQDIQHMPNSAHGNAMCDGLNYARNTAGFIIRQWALSYEYASRIDEYFDKYGYAMMTAFVPSRLNRKHWSYLKTTGCNIKGNINNTDLLTIKTIYDNGITTWKNLEEVGDYSLDNTVDESTAADEPTDRKELYEKKKKN
jgi:hypothetical protein